MEGRKGRTGRGRSVLGHLGYRRNTRTGWRTGDTSCGLRRAVEWLASSFRVAMWKRGISVTLLVRCLRFGMTHSNAALTGTVTQQACTPASQAPPGGGAQLPQHAVVPAVGQTHSVEGHLDTGQAAVPAVKGEGQRTAQECESGEGCCWGNRCAGRRRRVGQGKLRPCTTTKAQRARDRRCTGVGAGNGRGAEHGALNAACSNS